MADVPGSRASLTSVRTHRLDLPRFLGNVAKNPSISGELTRVAAADTLMRLSSNFAPLVLQLTRPAEVLSQANKRERFQRR
jgi:hypothetical protein